MECLPSVYPSPGINLTPSTTVAFLNEIRQKPHVYTRLRIEVAVNPNWANVVRSKIFEDEKKITTTSSKEIKNIVSEWIQLIELF